ncbi:MAG: YqiA/YcfP family alpha/beta fold hydrolase [Marinobacter sp.]|uniref:YqiA/YcfP family alpha/beta fold hydrolase n=1 Tax=Marinobacter sp. TaxID=50741 RepID=UPI00299D40DF|nr:YqiA/YcfP family alpha/beta fold hydrolase [Marinobacter sp.]MDX1633602.1 YqiA/YcfP family alpha/beta fold hydrolase [Marinobacter sp.]
MSTNTLHVFLSHGLESGPESTKIQALKAEAETFDSVEAVALDHRNTRDPKERLAQMREAMESAGAYGYRSVLVGSSMGGWVCAQTSADTPVLGCFLMAPALGMKEYPESSPVIQARHCQIIHGWEDDVVEPMPVVLLAQEQTLPILVLPDGHRLQNSLDRVVAEFRLFMQRCLGEA